MKAPNDLVAQDHISEAMGGKPTHGLGVMTIRDGDLDRSVKDDVRFLRESEWIKKEATITGWVYDT